MSNIGYLRTSASDQNIDRQVEALTKIVDKMFIDQVSGKNLDRPELKKMLNYIREGDKVYVESISRFARNTRDLLWLVDELQKKEVEFISLKEKIDTSTPAGRFMLTVFAAVSELERDYILQRQKEGIAIARAQNKPMGRPKATITRQFKSAYKDWRCGKINGKTAIYLSGYKKATFYRLVKEYEKELSSEV